MKNNLKCLFIFMLPFFLSNSYAESSDFEIIGEVYCEGGTSFRVSLINQTDEPLEFHVKVLDILFFTTVAVTEHSNTYLKAFYNLRSPKFTGAPLPRTITVEPNDEIFELYILENIYRDAKDYVDRKEDLIFFWSTKVEHKEEFYRFHGSGVFCKE